MSNEQISSLQKEYSALFEEIGRNPNLVFVPKFREFGIRVADGGGSYQIISFCPFSGEPLPTSLRKEWFERIWAMGFEPGDDSIPRAYTSAGWWEDQV